MTRKVKTRRVRIDLNRRDFLTMAATAAGSVVAAQALTTGPLSPFADLKQRQVEGLGETAPRAGPHWGMVIDLDRCIGCEYCLRACSATNDVEAGRPWNIVERDETSSGQTFFFSRPCLHCQHAPCVEVCPVEATYVRDDGLVVMDYDRCIGCRYCEVACPFEVPKFEWDRWNPRIVKCELCFDRLREKRQPACTEVCPTHAVIFGLRSDLLATAKSRIAASPGRYFEDRVYGEHEVGGTQVLYLSRVAFDKIGLPRLRSTSLAHYATRVSSVIYRWLAGPLLVAAVLGTAIRRNWNRHEAERPERERRTGLPDQL